jgi:antitoxin VapB
MLSIRNPETERLARLLAARRGVTMTEAITQALRKEVASPAPPPERSFEELMRSIRAIQDRIAASTPPDAPSVEQIMDDMYDEFGNPR